MPSFAISLSLPTVVASRLMSCKTRDFSVLYSKDLIILNVNVADVFGLARFVRTSEIAPSPDAMISTSNGLDGRWAADHSAHLCFGVTDVYDYQVKSNRGFAVVFQWVF